MMPPEPPTYTPMCCVLLLLDSMWTWSSMFCDDTLLRLVNACVLAVVHTAALENDEALSLRREFVAVWFIAAVVDALWFWASELVLVVTIESFVTAAAFDANPELFCDMTSVEAAAEFTADW